MATSTDLGTTGVTPGAHCSIPGYMSSQQLREAPLYFQEGPTGRSIWSEWLTALMYERVTTDPGFNRVDVTWVSAGGRIYVETKALEEGERLNTRVLSLHDLVSELRARLGMSVEDLAAMCGVKRRQLYNLMSGTSTSTAHEAHIRWVATLVDDLYTAVGASSSRVRSLALHPVDGISFYELARAQDARRMETTARELIRAVEAGEMSGSLRRPSPRRRAHARAGSLAELHGDGDGS